MMSLKTGNKMKQFQKYVFLLDEIIASRNSDNSLLNFQSFPVHFLAFPEGLSKTDLPFRVQGVCSHVLPRRQRSAYVLSSTADIGLIYCSKLLLLICIRKRLFYCKGRGACFSRDLGVTMFLSLRRKLL